MTHYLTPEEVDAIHLTHVKKSDDYFNQYPTINHLIQAGLNEYQFLRFKDAPRCFTILDFKQWIIKHNIHSKNALIFHPGDPELEFLPKEKITTAIYDGSPTYDLHCIDLNQKDFDFILLSHTLEHVNAPEIVVQNLYKHLAPNGYVFASLPTINIPHCTPNHFQHLQPDGLACLFVRNGFDVVEIGYWGNADYCVKLFSTRKWPDVYDLNNIKNDPELPVQTWILAQKKLPAV